VIAMAETQVKDPAINKEYFDISDDDSMYSTRSHTSTRRYQRPAKQTMPDARNAGGGQRTPLRRSSRVSGTDSGTGAGSNPAPKSFTAPITNSIVKQRRFSYLALAAGMLLMILLVLGVNAFSSWLQVFRDDLTYGRPRTYQFNAVVGHSDSASSPTHFIIINLNRHIEIIEFPGGDATHARIYSGPVLFGNGQNLTPVTATVKDVNGDGKPDLILYIQGQVVVFINTGTAFRPLQPGEHINLST
jgi:hypothetical protein